VLRAGNFIAPDHRDDVRSLLFLRAIGRGKIMVPGKPDVQRSSTRGETGEREKLAGRHAT
jgi:hypothetical protein